MAEKLATLQDVNVVAIHQNVNWFPTSTDYPIHTRVMMNHSVQVEKHANNAAMFTRQGPVRRPLSRRLIRPRFL